VGVASEWSVEATPGGWVLIFRPPSSVGAVGKGAYGTLGLAALVIGIVGVGLRVLTGGGQTPLVGLALIGVLALLLAVFLIPGVRRLAGSSTEQSVELRDGVVVTIEGEYDARYLESLAATAAGAAADRQVVSFSTPSTPHATLIGWPGVRDDELDELLAAVGALNSKADANKRIEQNARR
jgi:hypothetical protein